MYDAVPQDYRAARDMLTRRFKERWAPNFDRFEGEGVAFNVTINLGPEPLTKPAANPEVTAGDAQAIEIVSPATKV